MIAIYALAGTIVVYVAWRVTKPSATEDFSVAPISRGPRRHSPGRGRYYDKGEERPKFISPPNDNDALVPEIWSREALMTLMSNTVMSKLVHEDHPNPSYGTIINTMRKRL